MSISLRFVLTSATALSILSLMACSSDPAAENEMFTEEYYAAHGVLVALETVRKITWKRVEDALDYVITADGVAVGSGIGSWTLVGYDGPFQEVIIEAFGFGGDPRGEAELISIQPIERYVIYWDEARFSRPYVGVRDGSVTNVSYVTSNPLIIWADPGSLGILLFGNGVEDEDRRIPSPFDFRGGGIIEHGPFLTLIRR